MTACAAITAREAIGGSRVILLLVRSPNVWVLLSILSEVWEVTKIEKRSSVGRRFIRQVELT
jgi:hypothetical protein